MTIYDYDNPIPPFPSPTFSTRIFFTGCSPSYPSYPSSQALAFYCPWLSTKYAFKCPASWNCLGWFFLGFLETMNPPDIGEFRTLGGPGSPSERDVINIDGFGDVLFQCSDAPISFISFHFYASSGNESWHLNIPH